MFLVLKHVEKTRKPTWPGNSASYSRIILFVAVVFAGVSSFTFQLHLGPVSRTDPDPVPEPVREPINETALDNQLPVEEEDDEVDAVNENIHEDMRKYMATVREITLPVAPNETKSFYDLLRADKSVPFGPHCKKCIEVSYASNCLVCAKKCDGYCNKLCKFQVDLPPITRNISIHQPRYDLLKDRFIPRIIHQTSKHAITIHSDPEKYRKIESWKRVPGWEYRFYDDNDISQFIKRHFPHVINEAFETLLPGAFRADLFRYCVLLIHGGVYADVDVLLEADLDLVLRSNVSFLVPRDTAGEAADTRSCLWNGLLGSSPGHPILARTLEDVVNSVRNRFTDVDIANQACPEPGTPFSFKWPELSLLHGYDVLHTTGPCRLGLSTNALLGRPHQANFEEGGMDTIHGHAIILDLQKNVTSGALRILQPGHDLILASSQVTEEDPEAQGEPKDKSHYSMSRVSTKDAGRHVYGERNVYADQKRANERIRITVVN